MGGRKRPLAYRKYAERRNGHSTEPLVVSLPLSSYDTGPVESLVTLYQRIASLPLPPSWVVSNTANIPITLCKLRVTSQTQPPRADVLITLTINAQKEWVVSFIHQDIDPSNCPLLSNLPPTLPSVSSITNTLCLFNSSRVCVGTLTRSSWQNGNSVHSPFTTLAVISCRVIIMCYDNFFPLGVVRRSAFLDDLSLADGPTIRHANCQFLMHSTSTTSRCTACTQYRPSLVVQKHRALQSSSCSSDQTSPSSHVNYRYSYYIYSNYVGTDTCMDVLKVPTSS